MIAAMLVAAIYAHFLLFAQFGFLHGIRGTGHDTDTIHLILGIMALTGMAGSLAAPGIARRIGGTVTLSAGFALSAAAAALAGWSFSRHAGSAVSVLVASSALTGVGLALATVTLAGHLRGLTRAQNTATWVGLGTGAAYLFCNIPPLFAASPAAQSWIACLICGASAAAVLVVGLPRIGTGTHAWEEPTGRDLSEVWFGSRGIMLVTFLFFTLVWFDSAAFASVQLQPALQSRFWGTPSTLWANGVVHAAAALAGGILIDRGGFRVALFVAMTALIVGSLAFAGPDRAQMAAAPIYAAGVSVYSTALAAFAGLGPERQGKPAVMWRAAWIYGIAGWFGSTAGVGLAEKHGSLPMWGAPVAAAAFALVLGLTWANRNTAPEVAG